MATSLVESMSEDFDATEFSDDYQRALGELIDARAQGAEPPKEFAASAKKARSST